MNFYQQLQERTAAQRAKLLAAPIVGRALRGAIRRAVYVAFLTEAYHHVRHTVPLLMAVGARLPDYARIHAWQRLAAPLSAADGLLTDNGRPRRDAIARHYAAQIAALYHDRELCTE